MNRYFKLSVCFILLGLPAHADSELNKGLISMFQINCFMGTPDFDAISAKAEAMRMVKTHDDIPPAVNGTIREVRSWDSRGMNIQFTQLVERITSPAGTFTSCGIGGQPNDAAEFRSEFIKTLKLEEPETSELPNGSQIFYWKLKEKTMLSLTEFKSSDQPGVVITYLAPNAP